MNFTLLEIIKFVLPIILLIFLLRTKIKLYFSIFLTGALFALFFGVNIAGILKITLTSLYERATIELVIIVYSVLVFGVLLREKESIKGFVDSIGGIFKKKSAVSMIAPALIGLLPMPGGALVSAPVLNEIYDDKELSPEKKTFLNFWFRHIWEYIWPLYQGIILTVVIFKADIVKVVEHQILYTILSVFLGVIYVKRFIKDLDNRFDSDKTIFENIKIFFSSLWEILLIVVFIIGGRVFGYKIKLVYTITGVVLLSLILWKDDLRKKVSVLKSGFKKVDILLVVVMVMVFKNFVLKSGVVDFIKRLTESSGSFEFLILFSVPFLIGFLTGVNTAFAGISFPLFIGTVGIGNPDYLKIAYLYVSGFAGVLLSPVHFCLVLSAEYYGAELKKVYKCLLPPVIVIIMLSSIIYLLSSLA